MLLLLNQKFTFRRPGPRLWVSWVLNHRYADLALGFIPRAVFLVLEILPFFPFFFFFLFVYEPGLRAPSALWWALTLVFVWLRCLCVLVRFQLVVKSGRRGWRHPRRPHPFSAFPGGRRSLLLFSDPYAHMLVCYRTSPHNFFGGTPT